MAGTAADLLVAEESVAATATAREGGEKSNLLHEGFSKLGGSPYGSFGVLCSRGWYRFIGIKTPHIYIN